MGIEGGAGRKRKGSGLGWGGWARHLLGGANMPTKWHCLLWAGTAEHVRH